MSGTGKTPHRWISLCDRAKNNKAYVKENSESGISTEKTPRVEQAVGLKLPAVNFSPWELISQINVI